VKLFCAVLLSIFVGVLSFGGIFFLAEVCLDKTIYGESFAKTMADRNFNNLQEYVEDEGIGLDNLHRINAWCSRGEKVYLTLYHEDVLVYESPVAGETRKELSVQEADPSQEDPAREYLLTLGEGITVRAFLYYYAGDIFYFGMTVLAGVAAFVAFSLCFVGLINRKVSYITQLKRELDILSGGQLEHPVTVGGRDELGELAQGIDQMRRSILAHQEKERQMREANSELITAMSHDLRTPLTSLLAYLEILQRKKSADKTQREHLIHKSIGQTLRIRQMADQLFEYFLVYATEWERPELEPVDGDQLFGQLLEEYADALENNGLKVSRELAPLGGQIHVNPELFRRVMDNMYSNLLKYADPGQTVRFSCGREGKCVRVTVANEIRSDREKKESTSIGLNTCRRILACHGGEFAVEEQGNMFYVTLSIPLKN